MKNFFYTGSFFLLILLISSGCSSSSVSQRGDMGYKIISPEPDWIRNGEPLEFEGELWYPRDTIDILTDAEMFPLGEYRGIVFYLNKVDVRPFDQLYTKFGKNKFRVFETKKTNDTSQRAF